MKLVDLLDSKSCGRKPVSVRLRPEPPTLLLCIQAFMTFKHKRAFVKMFSAFWICALLSSNLWAQKSPALADYNSILFSAGGQSWTSRDQMVYGLVLNEVYKKKNLSPMIPAGADDFILSRLSQKEASLFDLAYEKIRITDSQIKKMGNGITREEAEKEVEYIAKAHAILELKQNQHQEPDRFTAWVDLLKRKYLFKQKSGQP